MKNVCFYLLISILSVSFLSNCSLLKNSNPSCKNQKWMNSTERSQGDGWLWFKGKSSGRSNIMASVEAEYDATRKLMLECKYPHKNARFVERCSQEDTVHVRISVKQNECGITKSLKSKNHRQVNQPLIKLIENWDNSKKKNYNPKRYKKIFIGMDRDIFLKNYGRPDYVRPVRLVGWTHYVGYNLFYKNKPFCYDRERSGYDCDDFIHDHNRQCHTSRNTCFVTIDDDNKIFLYSNFHYDYTTILK